jgi:hypothetical protein
MRRSIQTPSFRDGPKDQTRNLEIPGSRCRAPRNDGFGIFRRALAYSASSTAFAISAVPLLPPNSIGLIPAA